jgi:WG containing repeat
VLYPISVFERDDSPELLVGYIDARGTVAIPPVFGAGEHFSEGKAAVVDKKGRSGFIDSCGRVVIPYGFQGVGIFREGVCPIGSENRVGYINQSGRWLIEPKFLTAMNFSDGRAFVSTDAESFRLIDLHGLFVTGSHFERARPFRSGLAPVRRGGHWGFIERNGETRIPFMFEDTQPGHFRSFLAGVKTETGWGFIDRSGLFAIKPIYEAARAFSEGRAAVRLGGQWGMINSLGDVVVQPRLEELGELVNGLAAATAGGKAGYVDADGQWVIEPKYDKCHSFVGELALVKQGESHRYIRVDGETVWESEPHAIVRGTPMLE